MYAKHDKNINRNKSFHPLTYGNLRKTEEIKENQEKDAKAQQERQKELRKDQEQRRYDELVMSASSSGMGVGFSTGASAGHGALRLVDDIFADDDAEQPAKRLVSSSPTATTGSTPQQPHAFLAKFKKEESTSQAGRIGSDVKEEPITTTVTVAGHKRARDDLDTAMMPSTGTATTSNVSAKVATGFITTSEVARLRAEHELVKKQQLDPLLKVQRHQDRTVAEAARAREMQRRHDEVSEDGAQSNQKTDKSAKQAIQDILKQLQARSRERQ